MLYASELRKAAAMACGGAVSWVPCAVCLAEAPPEPPVEPTETEKLFLDRLMLAESGGRLNARNAATGAYGPFQFLSGTFLDVVQRNFPNVGGRQNNRRNPEPSRRRNRRAQRSPDLYPRERKLSRRPWRAVTAASLRMSFFVGPSGALKVLTAKPEEPLSNILSAAALQANPILAA